MTDVVEKPLPTPRAGQSQSEFVSSCMSNSAMKKEFPDEKQRTAVCYSQWRKKSKFNKKDEYEVGDTVIHKGMIGKIVKITE